MSRPSHSRAAFKYIVEDIVECSMSRVPRSIQKRKHQVTAEDLLRLLDTLGIHAEITITFDKAEIQKHFKSKGFAKRKRDTVTSISLIDIEDVDTFTI